MKIEGFYTHASLVVPVFFGMFFISCSGKIAVPAEQSARMQSYIESDNIYIAGMFPGDDGRRYCDVQPALTDVELEMLDMLADAISPEVRREFDKRYTAWIDCWASTEVGELTDSPPAKADIRYRLKCDGTEFHRLIDFCRRQDAEIFVLLHQLAARAECPYDQWLLYPVVDLIGYFPELKQHWDDVNLLLENEKPDPESRTCNESTIWRTRKLLQAKYGYTRMNALTAFFDARKTIRTKR